MEKQRNKMDIFRLPAGTKLYENPKEFDEAFEVFFENLMKQVSPETN